MNILTIPCWPQPPTFSATWGFLFFLSLTAPYQRGQYASPPHMDHSAGLCSESHTWCPARVAKPPWLENGPVAAGWGNSGGEKERGKSVLVQTPERKEAAGERIQVPLRHKVGMKMVPLCSRRIQWHLQNRSGAEKSLWLWMTHPEDAGCKTQRCL